MAKSLNSMVATYLLQHRKITAQTAFEKFGIIRLSSCIFELRSQGYPIETDIVLGENKFGDPSRYAVYRLPKGWKRADLEKPKK